MKSYDDPSGDKDVANKEYVDIIAQRDFPDWSRVSEIDFDSGWLNLPVHNAVNTQRLTHGIGSEPDIVFFWGRATDYSGGYPMPYLTPVMDSHRYSYGPHIVAFDGTKIDIHAAYSLTYWTDAAGTNRYGYLQARILGISKTPDYNSGWTAFSGNPAGLQFTKAHGLGSVPDFYILELSNNSDGSGHHVYAMEGHLNYSGSYSTTIVDVNSTNIIFSVGTSSGVQFYDYGNNVVDIALTNWYYRVKAWSWTPDYTSSWTAVNTSDPNDYVLQHDLGKIPFLALLEFSKASDGSDDIVPIIGHCSYNADPYNRGFYISNMGENTISMHAEDYTIVGYEDSGGTGQQPSTGYVRVKLWI